MYVYIYTCVFNNSDKKQTNLRGNGWGMGAAGEKRGRGIGGITF